jgi:hypothetical protein
MTLGLHPAAGTQRTPSEEVPIMIGGVSKVVIEVENQERAKAFWVEPSGSSSPRTPPTGRSGGWRSARPTRPWCRVFLAGRTLATLDKVAGEIRAAGGVAETAQVDALDERAVDQHADAMA